MGKVTICPHFLVEYPIKDIDDLDSIDIIESKIILPLQDFLTTIDGIKLILSDVILEEMENQFPWSFIDDDRWKGYILDWYGAISIAKSSSISVNVPSAEKSSELLCSEISDFWNVIFENTIVEISSKDMGDNKSSEGVFVMNCGLTDTTPSYCGCCAIKNISDVNKVLHPWLRLYKKELPIGGEYPFIPPKKWKNFSEPKRAKFGNKGFLDDKGNSWQWDMCHKDHWDVQHSEKTGDYTNVNCDGKILPKNHP